MPAEKKKVNLVNLKTKFGIFLYNNYGCQNCYSIDKLAFGFTCDHKFCTTCNDELIDQCKVCKSEIDSVTTDKLQDGLFSRFDDLKDIMSIDLNRVANKLRQSNGQQQTAGDKNKQPVAKDDNVKEKADEKAVDENNQVEEMNVEEPEKEQIEPQNDDDKSTDHEDKPANRTSRRQAAKKANESLTEPKKPAAAKQSKDVETVKNPGKSLSRTRETSRSKDKPNLKNMFEGELFVCMCESI